jgi:transaldolase
VISQGISVNVTLIFSLDRYRAVMDAYLSGLEQAHAAGRDLTSIRSVASFFISRVDTEVDARLDHLGTPEAAALKGLAAIANARLAYQAHEQLTAGGALAAARPPRRTAAAAAVGLHRSQESRLPGHQVRRRADRARHRQHHAGRRPWKPSPTTARSVATP